MDSVNECCVFKIDRPNEFEGREGFEYEYVGNFKVQGTSILLFPPDYPDNPEVVRIEDLADPRLYHNLLGYFKKPEWEIELFLSNRRFLQDFLSKAKMQQEPLETGG